MSNRSSSHRDREGGSADDPPMSRLFIICNKSNTEEDFRSAFEKYGEIEEIWVVRDKHSGENKGKHRICLLVLLLLLRLPSILVNHLEIQ